MMVLRARGRDVVTRRIPGDRSGLNVDVGDAGKR